MVWLNDSVFTWVIKKLSDYMSLYGTAYDADKNQQYPHVRKEMAKKYKGF